MHTQQPHRRPTEDEVLLAAPPLPEQVAPFTQSDTWRVFRILGEFVEGFDTLATVGPAISIFGSARTQPNHPQYRAAVETTRLIGEAGYTIITGGGPGIMQAGNEGAREAGVLSIGLNIELPFEQGWNRFVDLPVNFRYFFARKTMFVKYACGYVVFPGGFGTLDELFESLTLIQTGKINSFPVVLFDSAYWAGLLDWLKNTLAHEGKISPDDLDLLYVTDSPEAARDHIVNTLRDQSLQQEKEAAALAAARRAMGG